MPNTTNSIESNQETIEAACPECESPVGFTRTPLNGEITECSACNSELEVTCRTPLRLELAPEVEEDWGE